MSKQERIMRRLAEEDRRREEYENRPVCATPPTQAQINRAFRLLQNLVDGCRYAQSRNWKSNARLEVERCREDSGKDHGCDMCMIRDLLAEVGVEIRH